MDLTDPLLFWICRNLSFVRKQQLFWCLNSLFFPLKHILWCHRKRMELSLYFVLCISEWLHSTFSCFIFWGWPCLLAQSTNQITDIIPPFKSLACMKCWFLTHPSPTAATTTIRWTTILLNYSVPLLWAELCFQTWTPRPTHLPTQLLQVLWNL